MISRSKRPLQWVVHLLMGCAVCACVSQQSRLDGEIGPGVAFEAGAEEPAEAIAAALPGAMQQVARAQRHDFKSQPTILVFASDDAFDRITGYHADRVAGVSTPADVYLAPQRITGLEPVLLHELSHVLLRQWIGSYRFHRTPIWFREGLATWAANGGGAGSVTPAQAAAALRSGRGFEPNLTEPLLLRKDASYWRLPHHLFYRQAAMFIDYLARTYPDAWQRLLDAVHRGSPFEAAYHASFSIGINDLWTAFVHTLG